MFETVELGRTLDKATYKAEQERLRTELLKVQRRVQGSDFSVVIVVAGMEAGGRGDTINLVSEWLDTRDVSTVAFDRPHEEERQRPPFWRYWMALPPRGSIATFVGAWYQRAVNKRLAGEFDDRDFDAAMARIHTFEQMLVDEGTLVIKLWLHLGHDEQKKKLKKLAKKKSTRWRVTDEDWERHRRYDEIRHHFERAIRLTSTGDRPWHLIEANDRRHRRIAVASQLLASIERRLEQPPTGAGAPEEPIEDPRTVLDTIDLEASLEGDAYDERLEEEQGRLARLARKAAEKNVGVMVVFEGVDAAGKGGAIRRIIAPLDARHYRVIRVAAPTDEERAHHYLWRFWRHLPRLGRFTIYDRSWYGRILVERVEGFATRRAWMRAYKEINDFEEQLVDFGIVLVKLWLHISPEEQLRRFEARENTPWKQYKITDEDYRNREKMNRYERAANDMVQRTSTEFAPWTLIPAEDKRYARVQVLETLNERIEAALGAAEKKKA